MSGRVNASRVSDPQIGSPLIHGAGPLWEEAIRPSFLKALEAGTLPAEAFRRWLAEDYSFAKVLVAFQAILIAKVPRDCHRPLIKGLAALDTELDWFDTHAARLKVELDIQPHPACRRYADFLMRCAYTQPYPVLLAILFGVEASYLAAWSALPSTAPYAEFVERWSSAEFAKYVSVLQALAERYPHEAAQEHFNEVLVHEREFWKMAGES
jgi:thiaminase/transcriptional activator TenA